MLSGPIWKMLSTPISCLPTPPMLRKQPALSCAYGEDALPHPTEGVVVQTYPAAVGWTPKLEHFA